MAAFLFLHKKFHYLMQLQPHHNLFNTFFEFSLPIYFYISIFFYSCVDNVVNVKSQLSGGFLISNCLVVFKYLSAVRK